METKTQPQVKARITKKLKAAFTRSYKKGGFKSDQDILEKLIKAYTDGRIVWQHGSF